MPSISSGTAFSIFPEPQPPKPGDYEPPVRLTIPSADIDSQVLKVGINKKGEMDVPSGKSLDVGWYKYGAAPGERGTAVIDAHVYAAFQNLDRVKPGEEIIVTTADNRKLKFVVSDVKTFKLSDLSPEMLFSTTNVGADLNLITCAGRFISSLGTYDRRLVVYTQFAGEVS